MKFKAKAKPLTKPSINNRLNLFLSATFLIALIGSLIGWFIKISPQMTSQMVEIPVKIQPSGHYEDVLHQLQALENKPNFKYMSKTQVVKELTQSNQASHVNSAGLVKKVVDDHLSENVFKQHARLTAKDIANQQLLPAFVSGVVEADWQQLNSDFNVHFGQRTWVQHFLLNPGEMPSNLRRAYNDKVKVEVEKLLKSDFSFTKSEVQYAMSDDSQFDI